MSFAAQLLGCIALLQLLILQRTDAATYVYVGYYYTYTSYTPYYYYTPYVSIGAIVGSVIGALSFLAAVVGIIICVCCVRRRRMMEARRAGVPMATMVTVPPPHISTVSGDGVNNYPKQDGAPAGFYAPPPYPNYEGAHSNAGYPSGMAYPPADGSAPYPQQQYPLQQPMMQYPPPAYQQPGVPPQAEQQRF